MWVKDGKYARIRTGAIVGQDMGFGKWVDEGEVFRVSDTLDQQCRCLRAYGYGVIGDPTGKAYGNGALFVKEADLIYESDGTAAVHYTPEAQKVHEHRSPHCYQDNGTRVFDERCETCTVVRTQAIKDVGAYVRLNYNTSDRAALIPNLHIKSLEKGKIPE